MGSKLKLADLWALRCCLTCEQHEYNIAFMLLMLGYSPRLYQTSISPLRVRTSMIVWPRKSSDSRLNFCFTLDLISSSSSQTRTLIRSEELWHSLLRCFCITWALILNKICLTHIKWDLKPLTNWSSHPIQGWGCRRWSWFVFWSCLLAP